MRFGGIIRMPAQKGRVSKYQAQPTWVEMTPPYRLHDHRTTATVRGIDLARMLFEGKKAGWVLCASRKEAERYGWLLEQRDKGHIAGLIAQAPYRCEVLTPEGELVTIGEYRADFVYIDAAGGIIIEDVKGVRTKDYRWKKKHVEAQYGIRITEVK